MLFEFDPLAEQKAKLKVVGVGGAGGNAINRMISTNMEGVDFIVINTDAQDLENNAAEQKNPDREQPDERVRCRSKINNWPGSNGNG